MSRNLPRVSLLDEGRLPVAELARIAIREGVRPRAAYQAHKWFARRLAITARALLVGAAIEKPTRFWQAFYRGNLWKNKVVLDPFVGGGVMLLEARRLGAQVCGVDIEPVAAAIARFQTTLRDLPDLSAPLKRIVESLGQELKPFYSARDEHDQAETLLHAFWVQQVKCLSCNSEYDAHPRFKLAWDEKEECQWIACSHCSRVIKAKLGAKAVTCSCKKTTVTAEGRIEDGEATCPSCGHKEKLIAYARRVRCRPRFRLFAVETIPSGAERQISISKRKIRSATEFDRKTFAAAEIRLREVLIQDPKALPEGTIPRQDRTDSRLIDYGYRDYSELFNARQKLHLALLGKAINSLKGEEREAMAIAFSDHLTTNNMMCAYAGGWRRLTPLFSIRAFRHIARPVEINPWLQKNGRGTFPNAVRSVERAAAALKKPTEPGPRGILKPVCDAEPDKVEIICGDARRMTHLQSQSVDLVLTDPPYFDYISYSELGHFFTPWFTRFRLIRKSRKVGFPKGQLASQGRSFDSERRFAQRLGAAFKEIHRICKHDGRIVFTYQNLDGHGWKAVARAMARAGVRPIRCLPLYGDSSAGLHKHARSISWDAVMVCEIGTPLLNFDIGAEAVARGNKIAQEWLDTLSAAELPLTEGDCINLSHASAIVVAFAEQREREVGIETERQTSA
jgi:putative DNA methylase